MNDVDGLPQGLPPGWYQDPADPAKLRYWNGAAWEIGLTRAFVERAGAGGGRLDVVRTLLGVAVALAIGIGGFVGLGAVGERMDGHAGLLSATGVVVDLAYKDGLCAPAVSFSVDGVSYVAQGTTWVQPCPWQRGAQADVYYDPAAPAESARIADEGSSDMLQAVRWVFLCAGVLVAAMGAIRLARFGGWRGDLTRTSR